jgi:hypothetical protein
MHLFAIFITKRLNISSAGKLSEHDSGTEAGGSILQVGPRMSENKDTLFYLFSHKKSLFRIYILQWAH